MRTCIVCGCTDELACDGGCHWVRKIGKDKGVCSKCPEPVNGRKLSAPQREERNRYARLLRMWRTSVKADIKRLHESGARYENAREASRAFERALRRQS